MASPTGDKFERARERLIDEIEREARATAPYFGKERFDDAVLQAIRRVPREAFVPVQARGNAYANRPLPIGHGQTISQPFIVAAMTDMVCLHRRSRVLEVGTGCGYQTAVLAEIAAEVYSIEVIPELAEAARDRLRRLGYRNVRLRVGDGNRGWPEHAPFDSIVVTAAAPEIPQPLVDQLALGGRMAIPIGRPYETQLLTLVEKDAAGRLHESVHLPVAFVPLVRGG